MFSEYMGKLPDHFSTSSFFPKRDDPFWKHLSPEKKEQIQKEGTEAMEAEIPLLPLSLYRRFSETGNRTDYETPYFTRRNMLCSLALMMVSFPSDRCKTKMEQVINAIITEDSWALPAHNGYIRDGEILPVPDKDRPVVDLFAAETGALFAMVLRLLEDELSPALAGAMHKELETRIEKPYLHDHFWWMGSGSDRTKTCNWSTWCTQNVLLCFFLLPHDDETRGKVASQACVTLDYFLKDYAEDGYCSEGASYYRHGILTLFIALAILDDGTDGLFAPLWENKKLKNMASFITSMHVEGPWYINYADCSAKPGPATAIEYFVGKKLHLPALMDLAIKDRGKRTTERSDISLAWKIVGLLFWDEMGSTPVSHVPVGDIEYPSSHLTVLRSPAFVFAIKAGDNDDAHNHNDTGSIILYHKGEPVLIDVGVGTYTRTTFSKDRYSLWTMQSLYHNVCNFGSIGQEAGKEYRATDIKEPYAASISMHLEKAYPTEAKVNSYVRSVLFDKEKEIISVREDTDGELPSVLTLMTRNKPLERQDGNYLVGGACLTFYGNHRETIETIPVTDERLKEAWPDTIYRLMVSFGKTLLWKVEEA